MASLHSASPCLFAVLACLLSPMALAQAASSVEAIPSPLSLGSMFQVLFGLLLVLAAVAAAAWLLRRLSLGHNMMGGVVRIVGGVSLGQRERLVLVEIGETWLLLGVAPGQINTLHSLTRPEGSEKAQTPSGMDFPAWLMQAIRKRSENRNDSNHP